MRLARRRRYSPASPTCPPRDGPQTPTEVLAVRVRQHAQCCCWPGLPCPASSARQFTVRPGPPAASTRGPCDRLPHAFVEPAPWLTLQVRDRHPHLLHRREAEDPRVTVRLPPRRAASSRPPPLFPHPSPRPAVSHSLLSPSPSPSPSCVARVRCSCTCPASHLAPRFLRPDLHRHARSCVGCSLAHPTAFIRLSFFFNQAPPALQSRCTCSFVAHCPIRTRPSGATTAHDNADHPLRPLQGLVSLREFPPASVHSCRSLTVSTASWG